MGVPAASPPPMLLLPGDRRGRPPRPRGAARRAPQPPPREAPSADLEINRSKGRRRSTLHLVVCNLLAGTWEMLPPLETSWKYWNWKSRKYGDIGYASSQKQTVPPQMPIRGNLRRPREATRLCSKSSVIYTDGDSCILNTFSSNEARWNTPVDVGSETRKFGIWGPLQHPNAVVWHGAAHWLVGSRRDDMHTLGVDAETGHVTLSKIVIEDFSHRTCDDPQLSVAADGTLSLLYLQRPGLRLNILVQQDHRGSVGPTRWLLSRVVELKPPEQRTPSQGGGEAAHLTLIGEKAGTLLVRDNNMRMYAGRMTELTFCGQVNRWNVVPFGIYWPSTIL